MTMHSIWWLLIVAALFLMLLLWNVLRDARPGSRAEKLATYHRLQRFDAEQRVRQQAAVMRRTREINAMAHETCQAMLRAAMEAQREELNRADE